MCLKQWCNCLLKPDRSIIAKTALHQWILVLFSYTIKDRSECLLWSKIYELNLLVFFSYAITFDCQLIRLLNGCKPTTHSILECHIHHISVPDVSIMNLWYEHLTVCSHCWYDEKWSSEQGVRSLSCPWSIYIFLIFLTLLSNIKNIWFISFCSNDNVKLFCQIF